jgi:hypothetical protein
MADGRHVVTDVSENTATSLDIEILKMEAAISSENSGNTYQPKWHNIPEGMHLHEFPLKRLTS